LRSPETQSRSQDSSTYPEIGKNSVKAALVRQLHEQTVLGVLGAATAAVVLAVSLWDVAPQSWILTWVIIFLVIQTYRLLAIRRFLRTVPSMDEAAVVRQGNKYLLGSSFTALLWGLGAFVLFPAHSLTHTFFLIAMIAGVAAATIMAQAPVSACYISSALLCVVPLAVRLFLEGHKETSLLGIAGLVFVGALLGTGRSVHRRIVRSIKLGFEKDRLLEDLSNSRAKLEETVSERTAELMARNRELASQVERRLKAEKELRDREERYRNIFQYSRDAIVIVSREGVFIDFNQAFLDMFGYSAEDLLSMTAIPLWERAEDRLVWSAKLERQGYLIDYPMKAVKKDGRVMDCLLTSTARGLLDGSVIYQSICRDVTDQMRAEKAIKESEARYRDLFENASEAIFTQGLSGEFTSANRAAEMLMGAERERILSMNIQDIFHPEDLRKVLENLKQEDHGGSSVAVPHEMLIRRPDGTERWIEATARLLQLDGQPAGIQWLARDVTERKLAVEALRQSETKFRDIVELLPQPVFEMNTEGRLTFISSRGFELFGYSHEDFERGMYANQVIAPEHLGYALHNIERVLSGEYLGGTDYTAIRKDGTTFPAFIHTLPMRQGDEVIGLRGIVVDMTARKKAEEKLREIEHLYRSVIDNIEEVFYRSDNQGKLLMGSPSGARLFGYETVDEMIGLPLDSFWVDPLDREKLLAKIRQHGSAKDFEAILKRKDGSTFIASFTTHFCRDETGKILGTQGIIRDVTSRKEAERQVMRSEERLRLAWDTSPDALSISKMEDGTYVDVNEGYFLLTGYTRDEVIGKSALELPFWADPSDRQPFVEQLKQHGKVRNFETRLRRKGGEIRSILVSAGVMMWYGEPHLLAVTKDIEDLKRAEAALSESEATLRSLLQAAPIGIGHVSSDRRLGWTNKVLTRMLGYSRKELEGQSSRILYPCEEEYLRVGGVRHPDIITRGTGSVETRFKRKDGTELDVLVSASAIVPGDLSHGLVFTVTDITERKVAEQELKRLGAAVEQAGEAILVTDPDGAILYVNPAFELATGYSRHEVLGKNPRFLKSGKHDRKFYQEMWETLLAGQVWRGRFTNKRKDGKLYEETATISSIKDENGRIVNYVGVKRDVTGESLLQKQLVHAQKMEAIGTLAGGMAHDFNNLLQAILGYSDLLLMKKGADDPDRKKLEVIQHAARDGADLVSRILTFSKKGESRTRPVDLNEEIRKAQRLLRRTVPRMIEIKLVLEKDLHVIDADPAQIEQVLLNLAINAQHAMPSGGQILIETSNVSLSDEYVRSHLGAKPGKYVLLTFSDTGSGISPEVLDRVFEPFFTTKANGEGTGLGLAMVHGIISRHGGYIRCYSEPGIGTSFKMYFPISEHEAIQDLAFTREMPAFGTETILLVDDDDRVRRVGRQMIEMGGYTVMTARSGEEAVEVFLEMKNEISLVILDLIMPGMGGKRCLEELLRIDPTVRILLASGYSSNGLWMHKEESGARGWINKPYDAKDILAAIRKVLDVGYL